MALFTLIWVDSTVLYGIVACHIKLQKSWVKLLYNAIIRQEQIELHHVPYSTTWAVQRRVAFQEKTKETLDTMGLRFFTDPLEYSLDLLSSCVLFFLRCISFLMQYGKKETGGVERVPPGYDRWGKSMTQNDRSTQSPNFSRVPKQWASWAIRATTITRCRWTARRGSTRTITDRITWLTSLWVLIVS